MIYEAIWPVNRAPCKAQIERMIWVAYRIDPAFVCAQDETRLGLDMALLRERGEVALSANLGTLRKHADAVWSRMSGQQRAAFIASYLTCGLRYVDEALVALSELGCGFEGERDAIRSLRARVLAWNANLLELGTPASPETPCEP